MKQKSPISYYGGKANLVPELLKLIPEHLQYVEPFCGGATLFWNKQPSVHEVLNDFDNRVINFWEVLQTDFEPLQFLIQKTLHSEYYHKLAAKILKEPITNRVEFAWAFWAQTNMSFTNVIGAGFAFNNSGKLSNLLFNKRKEFTEYFRNRLEKVEIFNRDALDLILLKDTPETFIYLDPPYVESDCGHYEKGKDVYYQLLDLLPTLKCKWLMSSYPSEQLSNLRGIYFWQHKNIYKNLSVSGKHNAGKMKTECLTWNYIAKSQQTKLEL
jgi:DNA adenine methylase